MSVPKSESAATIEGTSESISSESPQLRFRDLQLSERWYLAGIILLATILRLPGIATKPLWYDEAFAVLFSAEGLPAMIAGTLGLDKGVAADIHPLLYYSILGFWGRWLGTDPWLVRLLSVIIGVALVIIGLLFARQLFGKRIAFLSGLLLAASPFLVHYSQEVRMYGLLAMFLMSATAILWDALKNGGWWRWIGFGLLAAAAQYTHNLAALFLIPLSLTPVWMRRWNDVVRMVAAGGMALLIYSPWLLGVPSQLAKLDQAYWIAPPGAAELITTAISFNGGLPILDSLLPFVLFLTVLILVIGVYATLRALRTRSHEAYRALWLLYLALTPVALMYLISFVQPIYIHRAMLPSAGVFAIWLAWVIGSDSLRNLPLLLWTQRLAIVVVVVLGLFSYYSYREFPYAPFQETTAYLQGQVAKDEVVVHTNKITALSGRYYQPSLPQFYLQDIPGSGSDTLALPTQSVLDYFASTDIDEAIGTAHGVWLIFFPRELVEYAELTQTEHPAITELEAEFRIQKELQFGPLTVLHFRK